MRLQPRAFIGRAINMLFYAVYCFNVKQHGLILSSKYYKVHIEIVTEKEIESDLA